MKSTRLARKSAFVVGLGGLGGPALLVLASAGVGSVVAVDDGTVEPSDLHRQPLFREADLGRRRAAAAAERVAALFPDARVETLDRRLDEESAAALARATDVVLDGAEDFSTKFLVNDAALSAGKPLVHAGVIRYTAQLLTVVPGETGCLRCLFEAQPPDGAVPGCAESGVLGPLAGFGGGLLGAEAVRLLSGEPGAYAGRLVVYESRSARARAVPVRVRSGCAACRTAPVRAASPVGVN